jgi:transcriptional regulator with XRE-family HTH domain
VVKPVIACDLWDLTPPTCPPHSRLFSLAPVGLGTAGVESLTGYIARLAQAHSVRTRILVLNELAPLWGRARLCQPVNSGLSAFWKNEAAALNGTRRWARDGVQALETLTGRGDLRYLTLLPWAVGLSCHGLLRRNRAWCPDCYAAWQQTGQTIYEPLLWALEVVKSCPQHQRWLSDRCPHAHCRQVAPILAPGSRPGYCPRCAGWLGSEPGTDRARREVLAPDQLAWQVWVVDTVGELLAGAAAFPAQPSSQNIADAINLYIERACGGQATALARRLHVSRSTVSSWRWTRHKPQLELLLRLARLLGTSPVRLLTEGAPAVDFAQTAAPAPAPAPSKARRPRRPFKVEAARRALQAVLAREEQPPPALRQVAKRLGYSLSPLYRHCPDLCAAISARYLAAEKERGQEVLQRLCAEVRQAVAQLHAQDKYPSASRVATLLRAPGAIRHPVALATRHEALRQLGWES